MSKKPSRRQTKFSYTPQTELPPLKKIRTEWNLKEHYYKSEKDPQIEKDAIKYELALKSFVKKYKNTNFTNSTSELLQALKDYEKLERVIEGSKVILYFELRTQVNTNDNTARKKAIQYDQRFRQLHNELIFFSLAVGKIEKDKQIKILKDKKFNDYYYLLKKTFEVAKHNLTEAEEKIMSLRSNTSRGMWSEAVSKIRTNRMITFKKKTMSVMEALDSLDQYTFAERIKLWDMVMTEMEEIGDIAEHEITAVVNHDNVTNKLRGYKNSYTSSIQGFENDEKAILSLVDAVSTKGFELSKKFYKTKAKLHSLKTLPYANRMAPIGELPKPTFEQSVEVCRDVFYGLDKRYGENFDHMLENGHLDVFPKKGKRGSAFQIGDEGLPTYVFLNYSNSFQWLEVIAHEMGHATHTVMSNTQPSIYKEYTLSAAETASTLFEQLTTRRLLETLPEEQRILALHDNINRSIATIQRQIACFNFMREMYSFISEHGMATKQELAQMMQKHMKAHLGPAVDVTEKDGYSYVYWSHIRRGYYVYAYAYGHIISGEMIRRYDADPAYAEKIHEFLSAGGSKNVDDIFEGIGINTRSVDTYLNGLKIQENEIKELEKLTRKK